MAKLINAINNMGIRKRLLLLLVSIFIPFLLIQAFTYYDWFHEQKETELQANMEMARTVEKTMESFVQDVLHKEFEIGRAITSQTMSSKEITLYNRSRSPMIIMMGDGDTLIRVGVAVMRSGMK